MTKAIAVNDGPLLKALLGYVYGCAGDRAAALAMLEEITILAQQRYVSPIDFAVIYAGLDDAESTFQWLEAGYRDRATRIHELSSMYFDNFREDPRFASLLSRIGLPTFNLNR